VLQLQCYRCDDASVVARFLEAISSAAQRLMLLAAGCNYGVTLLFGACSSMERVCQLAACRLHTYNIQLDYTVLIWFVLVWQQLQLASCTHNCELLNWQVLLEVH
jgi:hypothetical protein